MLPGQSLTQAPPIPPSTVLWRTGVSYSVLCLEWIPVTWGRSGCDTVGTCGPAWGLEGPALLLLLSPAILVLPHLPPLGLPGQLHSLLPFL
jgi:hypothetical protein